MRGLTAAEYEVLQRTAGPVYFVLDDSNIAAARAVQARGLLGRNGRIIFVTPTGRLAMRIHESLRAHDS